MQKQKTIVHTPAGYLEISGSAAGVSSVIFVEKPTTAGPVPECLEECATQIEEYFAGKRKNFDIELDLQGSEFQLHVWRLLQSITFGKTISYKDLALMTGSALNTRAVGNANSKNPVSIIVPCHRVIGSNGKLTGYAGGLWRKEFLLRHEARFISSGLFEAGQL